MSWYNKTKLKKPYKVYMKCPGTIKPLARVNVEQSNEETEMKQAKAIVYKKFMGTIEDYRQIDCVLMATLDDKEWQRRVDVEKAEKEREEEQVQNAWWQD